MPPTKNVNHHNKCPSPQCASEEESLLVRQRLRNLLQLAIEIGLKEGLLGNQKILINRLPNEEKSDTSLVVTPKTRTRTKG